MSNLPTISVLTLIRGRQRHLDHLIAGLAVQTTQPDEVVIAYMQDEPPVVSDDHCLNVRFVHVPGERLPLAAARNRAAEMASGEILAFLDVDCIPDRQFVRRAREANHCQSAGVFLPEVHYLPHRREGWLLPDGSPDYERLSRVGERHPAKPDVSRCSLHEIEDFGELWGLAFILSHETWDAAGGMDESYVGYGGEETDLAQRLRASGAKLYWLGGTLCFHQHHTVHSPPLQHFEAIIDNARRFHDRWGQWCMDYWLDDFARRGLIERKDDDLRVLRVPTPSEVGASEQPAHVRFS